MKKDIEQELIRILKTFNEWWTSGKISDVQKFKSLDYNALIRNLLEREIILIVGARQVGKSTLINQLIEHLLKHADPKRIFLIKGDNLELNIVSNNTIKDSLSVYQTYVLKEDLNKIKEPVFIFIDEVQKIKNWPTILKNWYDINKKIKFVVSGSSSTKILKESRKVLVGRYIEQIVVPFKFFETLRYFLYEHENPELEKELRGLRKKIQASLINTLSKERLKDSDIKVLYETLKSVSTELTIHETPMKLLLNEYFVRGGYPRLVTERDRRQQMMHLETIVNGVIDTDLAATYSLRKKDFMKNLLVVLAHTSSQILNLEKLKMLLGEKSHLTMTKYTKYLEDAFLVSAPQNIRLGRMSRIRKLIKKVFVNDVGMRNYLINSFDEVILTNASQLGYIAEIVAFSHSIRLRYNLTGTKSDIFYWRNNSYEVDIVIPFRNKLLPIEVKYRNRLDSADFSGIERFMKSEKNSTEFGILISKDKIDIRGRIIIIPMLLFLLFC